MVRLIICTISVNFVMVLIFFPNRKLVHTYRSTIMFFIKKSSTSPRLKVRMGLRTASSSSSDPAASPVPVPVVLPPLPALVPLPLPPSLEEGTQLLVAAAVLHPLDQLVHLGKGEKRSNKKIYFFLGNCDFNIFFSGKL